MPNYLVWH
jgi:hypothetical protein